jgi:hypothetical protein
VSDRSDPGDAAPGSLRRHAAQSITKPSRDKRRDMRIQKDFRPILLRLGLGASLIVSPALAIDLHDYDDDLMRDLERTIKVFEPDIAAKNAQAAKEDAEILLDGFRYTEDYFTKKGKDDAVAISRDGTKYVDAVMQNIDKGDFEGAVSAARDTTQACKSCHELYKPRLAR